MVSKIFEKKVSSKSKNNKVLENTKKLQEKHVKRIGYKREVSSEVQNEKDIISDMEEVLDKSKKSREKSEEKEEEDDLTRQYIPPRYLRKWK